MPKDFDQSQAEEAVTQTLSGDGQIPRVIEIPEVLTVKDLASIMQVMPVEVIKQLMRHGHMLAINDVVEKEFAEQVVLDYGFEVGTPPEQVAEAGSLVIAPSDDEASELEPRPPVLAILGHVDHGKTTLLDAIRNTNVVGGEAGGITQRIGAYQVKVRDQFVTFLDTPGHEAFTGMRSRGARVTDVAILVVAADDGIMPQTSEAIDHIRAAGVPMVVAINKIDRPEADVERTKRQLAENDILIEEWGGDVIAVPISAVTGQGVPDLLDNVLLVSEVSEFAANPHRPGKGVIVEATLDKNRGPVATLLVQTGTVRIGDYIVAGGIKGRIKAISDDSGNRIEEAGPSMPVQILGLDGVAVAGEILDVVDDEKSAREIVDERQVDGNGVGMGIKLEELHSRLESGEVKALNLILKTDVQGTIEAVCNALEQLNTDETRVNVLRTATGNITEMDVMLAAASDAVVVGFNVEPEAGAASVAKQNLVEIRSYGIIYTLIEDIDNALKGLIEPVIHDVVEGYATVRAIFSVSRGARAAGVYVNEGRIARGAEIIVTRANSQIFGGPISNLKHFKDDVRELTTGLEGGVVLEGFNDFKEGDVLEAHRQQTG